MNVVVSLTTDQSVKFTERTRPVTGIGNYTSDRQPIPKLVMQSSRITPALSSSPYSKPEK